jgi:hypothetical protein
MFGVLVIAGIVMYFIPESPKYLVSKKRYDEAREILANMARINKVKIDIDEIKFESEVLALN